MAGNTQQGDDNIITANCNNKSEQEMMETKEKGNQIVVKDWNFESQQEMEQSNEHARNPIVIKDWNFESQQEMAQSDEHKSGLNMIDQPKPTQESGYGDRKNSLGENLQDEKHVQNA